ncbi:tensin-3-like isoform X3 [Tachypleus tridentatus]|uniref:tensin-3-like isoform X3 n=1 Tax=Tachypleus tridentatus TaxID=6853 RepID=UPI003FCF04B3
MNSETSSGENRSTNGVFLSHTFKTKVLKRGRSCDFCRQTINREHGSCCRVCKYTCHKECEVRVIASCEPPANYELHSQEVTKQDSSYSRTPKILEAQSADFPSPRRQEKLPRFIMDITYITERIIVLTFPESGTDATYRSNLKEAARDKYKVFNLSEKRSELKKLHSKVEDCGWPSDLAPTLEKLCSICDLLDNWLKTDPQHTAVLHVKGDSGRVGVVIAGFMLYSDIYASAQKSLDRFAMRRLYDDKFSVRMHPSQKRYIQYFTGLLASRMRTNDNIFYLQHIIIHGIPNFESKGCRPFVKIYQGMKPVYTTGVYSIIERAKKIIITIEPSLPLRGDVLIKCYHNQQKSAGRSSIFRVQFNTMALDQNQVVFQKEELDDAVTDSRFPNDGKVELQFSFHSNDYKGNGFVHNAKMPADCLHNSYENFIVESTTKEEEVNHTAGPVDGSLYAIIKKNSIMRNTSLNHENISPEKYSEPDGPQTTSRDSGISSSSDVHGCYSLLSFSSQVQSPVSVNDYSSKHSCSIAEAEVHNPQVRVESDFKQSSSIPVSQQVELDELMRSLIEETEKFPDLHSSRNVQPQNFSPVSSSVTRSTYSEKENSAECMHFSPRENVQSNVTNINRSITNSSPVFTDVVPAVPDRGHVPLFTDVVPAVSDRGHVPVFTAVVPAVSNRGHVRNASEPHCLYIMRSEQSSLSKVPAVLTSTSKPCNDITRTSDSVLSEGLKSNRPLVSPDDMWFQKQWQRHIAKQEGPILKEQLLHKQQVIAELRDVQAKNSRSPLSSPSKSPAKNLDSEVVNYYEPLHINPKHVQVESNWDVPKTKQVVFSDYLQTSKPPVPSRNDSKDMIWIRRYLSPEDLPSHINIQSPETPNNRSLSPGTFNEMHYITDSEKKIQENHLQYCQNYNSNSKPVMKIPASQCSYPELNSLSNSDQLVCISDPLQPVNNGFEPQKQHMKPRSMLHCNGPTNYDHEKSTIVVSDSVQKSFKATAQTVETCMCNEIGKSAVLKPAVVENFTSSYTNLDISPIMKSLSPTEQTRLTNHHLGSTLPSDTVDNGSLNRQQGALKADSHFSEGPAKPHELHEDFKAVSYNSSQCPSTIQSELHQHNSEDVSSHDGKPQGPLSPFSDSVFYTQSTPQHADSKIGDKSTWPLSVATSSSNPETPTLSLSPKTPYVNQEPHCGLFTFGIPKSPGMENGQLLPHQTLGMCTDQSSPSQLSGYSYESSTMSLSESPVVINHHSLFVKDTSKIWYKPTISRDEAINMLKDKTPGTFVIRNSNSFRGCFGLAMKVPLSLRNNGANLADPERSEMIRHFLIESTPKGVRLKGCPHDPVFGTLPALVYQYSVTPMSLPCRLVLPELEQISECDSNFITSSTKVEGGGNVLYLNSVDMETLTGPQAVRKALSEILAGKHLAALTVVHFRVSAKGITLTDSNRKLFFRRHYPLLNISYCGFDPDNRCWTKQTDTGLLSLSSRRCFGFVAKKPPSHIDNQCHVFAEIHPSNPASAVVSLVENVRATAPKTMNNST